MEELKQHEITKAIVIKLIAIEKTILNSDLKAVYTENLQLAQEYLDSEFLKILTEQHH
jgi:hypothetical protein